MKNSLARVIEAAGEPLDLTKTILDACAEVKGQNPVILNVSGITDMADYFVIVSARSDRQVEGIANKVMELLGQSGVSPDSVEGLDTAQWVVMDFSDVVLHIFYEPVREHYNLENLWYKAQKVVVAQ